MLKKELQIFTYDDLLHHFPLRHIDRTSVIPISSITADTDFVQVKGILKDLQLIGGKSAKRLTGNLFDGSGDIELTWFKGISWIQKSLQPGKQYIVFGKAGFFNGKMQMVHPEIENATVVASEGKSFLEPVYPSTEKLKARGLNGRLIAKLTEQLLSLLSAKDLFEIMPPHILKEQNLLDRYKAYQYIHFPPEQQDYAAALQRLKFEELFIAQLHLNKIKLQRHKKSKGVVFSKVGHLFNKFYHHYLHFELTGAQKRVLKEIRNDTAHGHQMNRLLQGDVGSGKTIVALLCMLLAADNNFQSCLMAPTEILASQHFASVTDMLKELPVNIRLLTGSTKKAERKELMEALLNGEIHLLIGTHALLEDVVQFKQLGLAIIDEQHRFGVQQRAALWKKSVVPPHVLVMTATPIPRTLAMTLYGNLDYSVIDELPPGRQPIQTVHRFEMKRAAVMDFIRTEIEKGRQTYIIYPLIKESEKLSYENLLEGYEQVKSFFPEHLYKISMVHGAMPAEQKEVNMRRFVKGETQIMVATTVIEVGINVPNATVMVIESAEKFGLSQLHQLRGRVGRGAEKSFCILLTGTSLNSDARTRIKAVTETNDGFKIAEKDMELRGPGDIQGTRQSGIMNFKLANIIEDKNMLEVSRNYAFKIISDDEELSSLENAGLKHYLFTQKGKTAWSNIS